jgi:hypothetical protein
MMISGYRRMAGIIGYMEYLYFNFGSSRNIGSGTYNVWERYPKANSFQTLWRHMNISLRRNLFV